MKRFIGVFTMSHENNGVRALPPETFETGERFRTPFLVCEDLQKRPLLGWATVSPRAVLIFCVDEVSAPRYVWPWPKEVAGGYNATPPTSTLY